MKNLKFLLIALLLISFSIYSIAGSSVDERIKFSSLPTKAQQFYSNNFSDIKIKEIERTENNEYEIEMENDTSIKFYSTGEWYEIDFNEYHPIPLVILNHLPAPVKKSFLSKNNDSIVIGIEKKQAYRKRIYYEIKYIDNKTNAHMVTVIDQLGNTRSIRKDK